MHRNAHGRSSLVLEAGTSVGRVDAPGKVTEIDDRLYATAIHGRPHERAAENSPRWFECDFTPPETSLKNVALRGYAERNRLPDSWSAGNKYFPIPLGRAKFAGQRGGERVESATRSHLREVQMKR